MSEPRCETCGRRTYHKRSCFAPGEMMSFREAFRLEWAENPPQFVRIARMAWNLIGLAGAAVGLGLSLRRWVEEDERRES